MLSQAEKAFWNTWILKVSGEQVRLIQAEHAAELETTANEIESNMSVEHDVIYDLKVQADNLQQRIDKLTEEYKRADKERDMAWTEMKELAETLEGCDSYYYHGAAYDYIKNAFRKLLNERVLEVLAEKPDHNWVSLLQNRDKSNQQYEAALMFATSSTQLKAVIEAFAEKFGIDSPGTI